jgi:hypothetical protein
MKIIAILSDFGYDDYYVPAMKAVILSINNNVQIIDITHKVKRWDIIDGAFKLYLITPYLPKDTIVLAVVDPGVGTPRLPIVIKTKNLFFVGPDNGLMALAAERDGIEEIHLIENERYMLKNRSTFDGRDVFAPIAAHISLGASLASIGRPLTNIKPLNIPKAQFYNNKIVANVLHIDYFGNIILNIPCNKFKKWIRDKKFIIIKVKERYIKAKVSRSYEELSGDYGLICGGTGFIEISLYKNSAASLLKVERMDNIVLQF